MSIQEIMNQRIPFEPHPRCPACGCMTHEFRFTMSRWLRDGNGSLSIDVTTIAEADPHLITTCTNCGFQHEMETMT